MPSGASKNTRPVYIYTPLYITTNFAASQLCVCTKSIQKVASTPASAQHPSPTLMPTPRVATIPAPHQFTKRPLFHKHPSLKLTSNAFRLRFGLFIKKGTFYQLLFLLFLLLFKPLVLSYYLAPLQALHIWRISPFSSRQMQAPQIPSPQHMVWLLLSTFFASGT